MAADKVDSRPIFFIIFGASGDLTRRKLIPALFSQHVKGRLPEHIQIVGFARRPYDHEEFRRQMRQGMEELAEIVPDADDWEGFCRRLWYVRGDLDDTGAFERLQAFIDQKVDGPAHRLYYLATAPSFFPVVIEHLGQLDMAQESESWRRIVIEKPFGQDLRSAQRLNQVVHAYFDEHQVYRIDHYLGKETAQNILVFRFLNTIYEPVWSRNYIDHVQITVAETVDVEHRGAYYDRAGVIRDMIQNHLLQLLTLVAMEPPATFDADAIRNEKVKVLQALRPLDLHQSVLAQYEGYCSTQGVADHSQTPTFAAIKLYIDNWRWQGVPFYLRSGKALKEKTTEIVVEFKPPPHVLFDLPQDYHLTPNFLSLCIQPDEGIHLRFETKVPGSPRETRSVDMEFHYHESFAGQSLPDAYERLLLDAIQGDASLFTRSDEIETAWKVLEPLLRAEDDASIAGEMTTYAPSTWGPPEAETFMTQEGRIWRIGCREHAD